MASQLKERILLTMEESRKHLGKKKLKIFEKMPSFDYVPVISAYETLVSKYGPEPKLPGLEYTPRQLMWLSGASVWCEVRRPASLKQQVIAKQ